MSQNEIGDFDDLHGYYVVVEFLEEMDENGIVPMAVTSSTWLKFEKDAVFCQWPSYLKTEKERIKAVIDHAKLDSERCSNSISAVNVKYKSNNYQKAISKLKRLEIMSSVSQSSDENDEPNNRKRSITRKVYNNYEYNCSSDEETIPVAPVVARDNQPKANSGAIAKSNIMKDKVLNSKNKGTPVTSGKSVNIRNSIFSTSTPTSTRFTKKSETPSNSSTYNEDESTFTATTSTPKSVPAYSRVQCHSCSGTEGVLRQLMTKVESLIKEVAYLTQIIQDNGAADVTIRANSLDGLPVSTEEELNQLNIKLEDIDTMTALCSSLQVVGGKDVIDTVRRILSRLLTNKVALSFNWSGRNNKNCFADQKNILKLIMVAVRKNPLSKNATQQEMEAVVKVWLRNAHDRDGGRQRRNKN